MNAPPLYIVQTLSGNVHRNHSHVVPQTQVESTATPPINEHSHVVTQLQTKT